MSGVSPTTPGSNPRSPHVRARLTKEVLDSFVAQSKHRGTPLPDRVQLWRGEIHAGPDGYHETFVKEAEN